MSRKRVLSATWEPVYIKSKIISIMAQNEYYPEEVLIEKMERGEYGWLDYVNHFSPEWQEVQP